jgi:hypothetical protein
VARNKNRITNIEDDGEYIEAQFVRKNGEVVIGVFKLIGWSKAPQAIHDEVTARMRRPAISTVLTGRR